MSALRPTRLVLPFFCRRGIAISSFSRTFSPLTKACTFPNHHIQIVSLGANVIPSSRLLSAKAQTSTEENGIVGAVEDKASEGEVMIHKINLMVQRSGRVFVKDVRQLILMVKASKNSTDALFALRCCGSVLVNSPAEDRRRIAEDLWSFMKSSGMALDVVHYNTLLRVYLDNDVEFSANDFLADLSEKGLSPNRVTYQHLISKFAQDGDISSATAILEHMKELNMSVNEQVFYSLIFGNAKIGNNEAADQVMAIMEGNGVVVCEKAYGFKLQGMIENGATYGDVQAAIDELKNKGIMLGDQTMLNLTTAFLKRDDVASAKSLVHQTPRQPGYFQILRNNLPSVIHLGHPELAFEMLTTFRELVAGLKSTEASESGYFFIESMSSTSSVEEILEWCDKIGTSTHYACTRLIEQYIYTKDWSRLHNLLSVLSTEEQQQIMGNHIFFSDMRRLFDFLTKEEALEATCKMREGGMAFPLKFLSNVVVPRIVGDDRSNLFRHYASLDQDLRTSFAPAFPQFALSKEDPELYRQAAIFCLLAKYTLRPWTWSLTFAKKHLTFRNMDVFRAIFATQMFYERNWKRTVSEVLPIIREQADSYTTDQTPDQVLNEILQDLAINQLPLSPDIAEQLGKIVTDEAIKATLKQLAANFERFEEIWSEEAQRKFVAEQMTILTGRPVRGNTIETLRKKMEHCFASKEYEEGFQLLDEMKKVRPNYYPSKEVSMAFLVSRAADGEAPEKSVEEWISKFSKRIGGIYLAQDLINEGHEDLALQVVSQANIRHSTPTNKKAQFLAECKDKVKDIDAFERLLKSNNELACKDICDFFNAKEYEKGFEKLQSIREEYADFTPSTEATLAFLVNRHMDGIVPEDNVAEWITRIESKDTRGPAVAIQLIEQGLDEIAVQVLKQTGANFYIKRKEEFLNDIGEKAKNIEDFRTVLNTKGKYDSSWIQTLVECMESKNYEKGFEIFREVVKSSSTTDRQVTFLPTDALYAYMVNSHKDGKSPREIMDQLYSQTDKQTIRAVGTICKLLEDGLNDMALTLAQSVDNLNFTAQEEILMKLYTAEEKDIKAFNEVLDIRPLALNKVLLNLLKEGKVEDAKKVKESIMPSFGFNVEAVKLVTMSFLDNNDVASAFLKTIEALELKEDCHLLKPELFFEGVRKLYNSGKKDEAFMAIDLFIEKESYFISQEVGDALKKFLRHLQYQSVEDIDTICDRLSEFTADRHECKIKAKLVAGNRQEALKDFEELAKTENKIVCLTEMVKEFSQPEDKDDLQRIVTASAQILGEETTIYLMARGFLESGKFVQAQRLLKSPGLRFNERLVSRGFHALESKGKINALEEYIRLCLPIFGADLNLLFDKLIDTVGHDANKVEDIWVTMQEHNFVPSPDMQARMGKKMQKDQTPSSSSQTETDNLVGSIKSVLLSKQFGQLNELLEATKNHQQISKINKILTKSLSIEELQCLELSEKNRKRFNVERLIVEKKAKSIQDVSTFLEVLRPEELNQASLSTVGKFCQDEASANLIMEKASQLEAPKFKSTVLTILALKGMGKECADFFNREKDNLGRDDFVVMLRNEMRRKKVLQFDEETNIGLATFLQDSKSS